MIMIDVVDDHLFVCPQLLVQFVIVREHSLPFSRIQYGIQL